MREDLEDFMVVEKLAESERAVKVRLEGHAEALWLPTSQLYMDGVQVDSSKEVDGGEIIGVPRWLATEKGLI